VTAHREKKSKLLNMKIIFYLLAIATCLSLSANDGSKTNLGQEKNEPRKEHFRHHRHPNKDKKPHHSKEKRKEHRQPREKTPNK